MEATVCLDVDCVQVGIRTKCLRTRQGCGIDGSRRHYFKTGDVEGSLLVRFGCGPSTSAPVRVLALRAPIL
jgi:hypothetical protein